jgi:hypothetical protein
MMGLIVVLAVDRSTAVVVLVMLAINLVMTILMNFLLPIVFTPL